MAAPKPLPTLSDADIARFWSKVDVRGSDECWLWQGPTDWDGYGLFKVGGSMRRAHCIAYLLHHGSDVFPLLACHTCDTPGCCNGSHLFGGTIKDNALDARAKGRLNTASGDNHGTRKRPESVQRGDEHWSRRMPERAAAGDRNGARTHPERIARGERLPQATLTADDVRAIRAEYARGGTTHRQLAEKYNVGPQCIQKVIARTHWKHIP